MEMKEERGGEIRVRLSTDEEFQVDQWTHDRRDQKRALRIPHQMHGEATFLRDRLGILAEYVTATALGLRYDPRPLGLHGNTANTDVLLPHGGAINAQYRQIFPQFGYALYSDRLRSFRTEHGVLVIPALVPGVHEIVGYISRGAFAQVASLVDFGKGLRLTAPRSAMRPLRELRAYPAGGRMSSHAVSDQSFRLQPDIRQGTLFDEERSA
jgi:hypothetical protein